MKLVVAATGASGALYLKRLLDHLDPAEHEIHLLFTGYARQVWREELGDMPFPQGCVEHGEKCMNAPFCSGSALFDAMVVIPCSMGTLGRVAAGTSDNALLRGCDVFLKERRKLVLVPRETPWNLIQARNIVTVMEAGAHVVPACPGFYSRPQTVEAVVDTVVARVLDYLGIANPGTFRWGCEPDASKVAAARSSGGSASPPDLLEGRSGQESDPPKTVQNSKNCPHEPGSGAS